MTLPPRLKASLRPLLSLVAAIVLAVSSLVLFAGPAEAASIRVCNHISSDDHIKAYNDSVRKEYLIYAGYCTYVDNAGGLARVDVDPSGYRADINSWYKEGPTTGEFSDCIHNEDGASNPFNSGFTRYYTSSGTQCQ